MKIGLIIIFRNNASSLNLSKLVGQIQSATEVLKFCFVDNNSSDNTLEFLYNIKEECEGIVEIVEIKKVTSEQMAKRAGARYLLNHSDLKFIGYINMAKVKESSDDLDILLNNIINDKAFLKELRTSTINDFSRHKFFKNILSIVESFKKFKSNHNSLRPTI